MNRVLSVNPGILSEGARNPEATAQYLRRKLEVVEKSAQTGVLAALRRWLWRGVNYND